MFLLILVRAVALPIPPWAQSGLSPPHWSDAKAQFCHLKTGEHPRSSSKCELWKNKSGSRKTRLSQQQKRTITTRSGLCSCWQGPLGELQI
ncbi:hypothetical protein HDV63DRAFT_304559 [Trichoderma sp. SZMC 28014]